MNIADIIVLLVIIAVIGTAVWIIRRNKKNGKCSCGCDCSQCGQGCQKK